jgi:HTH-type transcriptional regulator / antitoxin HigA
MDIQPIRSDADYEAALQTIAELMEAEPEQGTADFDRLDILATLVEAYEAEHHPVGPADPVETIRFHLDRLGWTQAELARQAGVQPTHLSAVLNRRRSLSLPQIKKLSALLDIPADQLIDNEFRSDEDGRASFRV